MLNKDLEDYIRKGWRVESDPEGIAFFGIGFIEAPAGSCYPGDVAYGRLYDDYQEWTDECETARHFAGLVIDYIHKGGELSYLERIQR